VDNTALQVAAKISAHQRVLDLLEVGADPRGRTMLVAVRSPSLEVSKVLAAKAIARLP
jgi:hypothetical protein